MRRKAALIGVVVLLTLFLVAMVGIKQYTLSAGTEVVLKMKPVDPRSLFRGDFVRLGYAIHALKPAALAGDDRFDKGDPVYVRLKRATPYWVPVSIHRKHPGASADHAVIKGTVRRATANEIRARYGIETYFVPEGEGKALERPKPGQVISLKLAVDRFGNAAIKAVLVDGKPRYVESLF